tara:strand:+ start:630 stop:1715 length:1086 start_codon:yes stop_codon:yes gene_type:complete
MSEPGREETAGTSLVTVDTLSEEARGEALRIAGEIDLTDTQAVLQFGVGAQTRLSEFADTVLREVRSKDSGHVGEILGGLMSTIKDVDVAAVSGGGVMDRMFGGLKRRIERFIRRYETLSTQIERIVGELDDARMQLLKDVALLDTLHQRNQEYLGELDVYIAAGRLKVQEARQQMLPELQRRADESGDAADAQRLQDFNQLVNRFEKKLHDMELSRMVALQNAPQIRLIQGTDQTLVEKIQSSILNTIPLWKNQVVIAISLYRQQQGLQAQREVNRTTNELLKRNAEMLKSGTTGVARENERGMVDIETLRKVNEDLIGTIDETLRIQQEGRRKRAAVETELATMEQDLKTRLKQITADE